MKIVDVNNAARLPVCPSARLSVCPSARLHRTPKMRMLIEAGFAGCYFNVFSGVALDEVVRIELFSPIDLYTCTGDGDNRPPSIDILPEYGCHGFRRARQQRRRSGVLVQSRRASRTSSSIDCTRRASLRENILFMYLFDLATGLAQHMAGTQPAPSSLVSLVNTAFVIPSSVCDTWVSSAVHLSLFFSFLFLFLSFSALSLFLSFSRSLCPSLNESSSGLVVSLNPPLLFCV